MLPIMAVAALLFPLIVAETKNANNHRGHLQSVNSDSSGPSLRATSREESAILNRYARVIEQPTTTITSTVNCQSQQIGGFPTPIPTFAPVSTGDTAELLPTGTNAGGRRLVKDGRPDNQGRRELPPIYYWPPFPRSPGWPSAPFPSSNGWPGAPFPRSNGWPSAPFPSSNGWPGAPFPSPNGQVSPAGCVEYVPLGTNIPAPAPVRRFSPSPSFPSNEIFVPLPTPRPTFTPTIPIGAVLPPTVAPFIGGVPFPTVAPSSFSSLGGFEPLPTIAPTVYIPSDLLGCSWLLCGSNL